jgi:GntR family transcriptional repressor for pyruvate dehydrogenase complex
MINKNNICDIVVDDIKKKIINSELVPGDKLPTERVLAEEYGVSRLPVREALRVLRELGYLETRHGKGTFIKSDTGLEFSKDVAQRFLKDKESAMEVFRLRRVLEVDSAKLATINGTKEELVDISKYRKTAEAEIYKLKEKKSNTFLEEDQKFHMAIAKATHNSIYIDLFNGIIEYFTMQQIVTLSVTEEMDDVVKYHRRIEKAIVSGNVIEAEKAMNSHMNRIEILLNKAIEESK